MSLNLFEELLLNWLTQDERAARRKVSAAVKAVAILNEEEDKEEAENSTTYEDSVELFSKYVLSSKIRKYLDKRVEDIIVKVNLNKGLINVEAMEGILRIDKDNAFKCKVIEGQGLDSQTLDIMGKAMDRIAMNITPNIMEQGQVACAMYEILFKNFIVSVDAMELYATMLRRKGMKRASFRIKS